MLYYKTRAGTNHEKSGNEGEGICRAWGAKLSECKCAHAKNTQYGFVTSCFNAVIARTQATCNVVLLDMP